MRQYKRAFRIYTSIVQIPNYCSTQYTAQINMKRIQQQTLHCLLLVLSNRMYFRFWHLGSQC